MALKLVGSEKPVSMPWRSQPLPEPHLKSTSFFLVFFFTFILQIFLLNYASEKGLSNDKQSVLKRKPFFFFLQKRTPKTRGECWGVRLLFTRWEERHLNLSFTRALRGDSAQPSPRLGPSFPSTGQKFVLISG